MPNSRIRPLLSVEDDVPFDTFGKYSSYLPNLIALSKSRPTVGTGSDTFIRS